MQAAAVYEMADRARARGGDSTAPVVSVLAPNGGEKVRQGESLEIAWEASDDTGIVSQTVEAFAVSGETTAIATGLDGAVRSLTWTVPADAPTGRYRVRVTATDAAGRSGEDSSNRRLKIRRSRS